MIGEIEEAARAAGAMMAGARAPAVRQKGGCANIVTETDLQVEAFLRGRLSELAPGSAFIGEEGGGGSLPESGLAWVVDPIDGTTNFARGIPMCCVSIALLRDAEPCIGVVYNPFTDQMFAAERGRGASCNGEPMRVSRRPMEDAVLSTAWCSYHKRLSHPCFRVSERMYGLCNDIRRMGTAANELCMLAQGSIELYFEINLSPWDYAAASLCVTEAGGVCSGIRGGLRFDGPGPVLAANTRENLDVLLSAVRAEVPEGIAGRVGRPRLFVRSRRWRPMEPHDPFFLKSAFGVFRMEADRGISSAAATVYSGIANGRTCVIWHNPSNGRFRIEVSPFGSAGRVFAEGSSPTFGGMASSAESYLESLVTDSMLDGSDDLRFFQTSAGWVAYYALNAELPGTPVVMVHGGPGGESNVARGRRLMLECPVYMYDQLGCGRSDPIPDMASWDAGSYVSELAEFVDGMGFEKVVLIGASWGAGLAAAYAQSLGRGKVEMMVLPSPFFSSALWREDMLRNISRMPRELREAAAPYAAGAEPDAGYARVLEEYCARYLFARPCDREAAEAAGAEEPNPVFESMWGPSEFSCTGSLRDFDVTGGLGGMGVPVLLMAGDSDEVSVETMLGYASAIPGSRLCIVPDAGHALAFEQPEMYRRAVEGFLTEHAPGRSG